MKGRRREDVIFGELPEALQPGDYWKYLDRETHEPMQAKDAPENLTGGVWGALVPGEKRGQALLMKHTVREHEDGTISVRPKDGSSNSILVKDGQTEIFHGYIEHGEWRPV